MEISNIICDCKTCGIRTNSTKTIVMRRNNLRFRMYTKCVICDDTKRIWIYQKANEALPQEFLSMKNFECYINNFQLDNKLFDFCDILRPWFTYEQTNF